MDETEFYQELYRSSDIGYDAVNGLLGKVTDADLRHDMVLHMEGYRHFGDLAKKELARVQVEAKRAPSVMQWPARIGMKMHTLLDTTPAHIAELMINGSNMSMLDMHKHLNQLRKRGDTDEAATVCQRMIDFEQDNIKRMQKYV